VEKIFGPIEEPLKSSRTGTRAVSGEIEASHACKRTTAMQKGLKTEGLMGSKEKRWGKKTGNRKLRSSKKLANGGIRVEKNGGKREKGQSKKTMWGSVFVGEDAPEYLGGNREREKHRDGGGEKMESRAERTLYQSTSLAEAFEERRGEEQRRTANRKNPTRDRGSRITGKNSNEGVERNLRPRERGRCWPVGEKVVDFIGKKIVPESWERDSSCGR